MLIIHHIGWLIRFWRLKNHRGFHLLLDRSIKIKTTQNLPIVSFWNQTNLENQLVFFSKSLLLFDATIQITGSCETWCTTIQILLFILHTSLFYEMYQSVSLILIIFIPLPLSLQVGWTDENKETILLSSLLEWSWNHPVSQFAVWQLPVCQRWTAHVESPGHSWALDVRHFHFAQTDSLRDLRD